MKWDQQKYDRLRAELEAMEAVRKGYVERLQNVLIEVVGVGVVRAERIAEHADALRDALEPFDSGVRQAKDDASPR